MSYKRILLSDTALARLRAIYERLRRTKAVYWFFHSNELAALVSEALRIVADIVQQQGTDAGPGDGLTP